VVTPGRQAKAVMIVNGRNDTSSPPAVMEVWADKLRAVAFVRKHFSS